MLYGEIVFIQHLILSIDLNQLLAIHLYYIIKCFLIFNPKGIYLIYLCLGYTLVAYPWRKRVEQSKTASNLGAPASRAALPTCTWTDVTSGSPRCWRRMRCAPGAPGSFPVPWHPAKENKEYITLKKIPINRKDVR